MQDKIESAANIVTHAGAGVAVGSFFTLSFWNENSAAIVAMAAVGGFALSLVSFIFSRVHASKRRERELRAGKP